MSLPLSYNQVVQLLQNISDAHYQINTFGWGDIAEIDTKKQIQYPLMWVVPIQSEVLDNTIQHTFDFILADLVNKDESNELETLSDTQEVLLDILKVLRQGGDAGAYNVLTNAILTPFTEFLDDEDSGHQMRIIIEFDFNKSTCNLPMSSFLLPGPTFAGTVCTATSVSLEDLTDVLITSPQDGQVLTYSGGTWINEEPTGTGGSYPKELISGGASWSETGFTYNVTELTYQFYGPVTTTPATTVTLASGDTSYDRIDAICIDINGVVVVIEGTPAASPSTPNVSEYILVQYIIVGASATEPSETIENIYLENAEWVGSIFNVGTATGTINFTGTTAPYAGIYDIEANSNVGRRIRLTSTSGSYAANEFQLMTMWVRFPIALTSASSRIFYLWLYNGSTLVGTAQNLFTLGLDRNLVNTWQQVIVPMSVFAAGSSLFDNIVMCIGGGTSSNLRYDLDNIKLSAGVVLPQTDDVQVNIQYSGNSVGQYPTINFIPGSNITMNVTGNTLNNRVDVTINSSGGGSGTDVYVTGGTYSSGTATFTNITGGTFDVTGFSTATGTLNSASNGLTVVGADVKLGGLLTENTSILGNGTRNLYLGTSVSELLSLNIKTGDSDANYTTVTIGSGTFVIDGNNSDTGQGVYNFIQNDGTFSQSTYDNNGTVNILSTPTSYTISGPSAFAGAKYAGDYSANFVNESLVTKRYVTGTTANYLPLAGGTMSGSINFSTEIDLYNQDYSSAGIKNYLYIGDGIGLNVYNDNTGYSTGINIAHNNNGTLRISADDPAFKGAIYGDDYSANYTNRSLIDKGYLTAYTQSQISGITASGNYLPLSGGTMTAGSFIRSTTLLGNKFFLDLDIDNEGVVYLNHWNSGFTKGSVNELGVDYQSIGYTSSGGNLTNLYFDVTKAMISSTISGFKGLEYATNYSANYTDRSLIDKGYLTSQISGFTTGGTSSDTYVTGGTYSNGTAIYTNNTGGTFSVTGFSTGGTGSFSQSALSGLTLASTTNINANSEYTKNFSGSTALSDITFTFSNFNDGSTTDLDLLKSVSGDTTLTFPVDTIVSVMSIATVTSNVAIINSTSSGRFGITIKRMGDVYKVFITQDIL